MQPFIYALKLELMENEFMTGPENGLYHYPDNVTLIGQKCEHVRPLSAQTVFQSAFEPQRCRFWWQSNKVLLLREYKWEQITGS